MGNKVNLVGQSFGYLKVTDRVIDSKHQKAYWKCTCSCGNETIVSTSDLRSGHTKSCGCKKFESHNSTHGMKHSRIYQIWCEMKKRCYLQSSKSYPHYGGRGIRVCDEWIDNFPAFYQWSMDSGYSDSLTIDRIDTNGNYSPENCRWSTHSEQQRNRTNNLYLEYNGETQTLSEWCRRYGVIYGSAWNRYRAEIKRYGHASFERVVLNSKL